MNMPKHPLFSTLLQCTAAAARRHATASFITKTDGLTAAPRELFAGVCAGTDYSFMRNFSQRRSMSRRALTKKAVLVKDPIEILLESPLPPELQEHDYFNVRNLVTVRDLFRARVHLGHTVGTLDTKMAHYLYGKRFDVCIFDLEKTRRLLGDALNVLAHIVYKGGIVLFVSRNRFHTHLIETTAREAGEYAHCRFWLGGTLTNAEHVFGSLTRLPDILVVLASQNSVLTTHAAILEAATMNIPTIVVVDSNSSPDYVTYPVPGNDDSLAAVELYCQVFRQTILRAKERRQASMRAGDDKNQDGAVNVAFAREVGSESTNRYLVDPSGRAGEPFVQHEIPPDSLDHGSEDDLIK